jgi:hypothetical protein
MMHDVYDDGVAVDQKVREYMAANPKVSYRDALRALMKEETAQEEEDRQEFSRRTEAYQSEFKKTYAQAAQMVAAHDPDMVNAYADDSDSAGLARSQGEIWRAAKRASSAAKISISDAVMRILQSEPQVAKKIGGDWLDRQARIEINNQNLGSSISVAYPISLRIVRNTFPEVTAMADFGSVTEMAMRIVFIGWFKD